MTHILFPARRLVALLLAALLLAGCDGGGSTQSAAAPSTCPETGAYACRTGESEPLYSYQWALNYASSFFTGFPATASGGLDLNVEPVHRQGIKGQGVRVLVVDGGSDLHNEDLLPNADFGMSRNLVNNTDDPYPTEDAHDAHGTAVAGIIGAAQNGKGVMGIAPRSILGAVNFVEQEDKVFEAHGGEPWSAQAHVFNASYGEDEGVIAYEAGVGDPSAFVVRSMKALRDGRGAIFVKSAGNAFEGWRCRYLNADKTQAPFHYPCINPANDPATLEPNAIVVAALNAMGHASSYSSAGPVVWITGMGGEYGNSGDYGEAAVNNDGPTLFSADLSGCAVGYSRTDAKTAFNRGQTARNGQPENLNCDYTYMNGTSAAAPTISGVVALMLSANPDLSWRDVRDILRLSARKVDADYPARVPLRSVQPYGTMLDLDTNQPVADNEQGSPASLVDGAQRAPVNLGWQPNGAGLDYSDWYGFGVPDAQQAVVLAQDYRRNPQRSRRVDVNIPAFQEFARWQRDAFTGPLPDGVVGRAAPFPYKQVTLVRELPGPDQIVDQFQLRMSGEGVCLGTLGIAVRSPVGTVSILKAPVDHFAGVESGAVTEFAHYALGSYAFHGESAAGPWQVFTISGNPDLDVSVMKLVGGVATEQTIPACSAEDAPGVARDFELHFQARFITQ
ncbi:MAG TPA: S8 family serine peptidase [Castellaniella sp.]|nr:S8 family serine peptidase [Castellaniella sp.]